METKKLKMESKYWRKCHYSKIRSVNIYWSHETIGHECTSIICDDLNSGMTIEQIWRKDYNCGKKVKGE